MAINRAGQRQIQSHEDRRPNDAVKLGDILADQLKVSRPITLKTRHIIRPPNACQIIEQRIQPHINDLFVIPRNRNSPVHILTGNRYIRESLKQIQNLMPTARRRDERRMLLDVRTDTLAITRNRQHIIILAVGLRHRSMLRTQAFDQIPLIFELFTAHTIQTLVRRKLNVAIGQQAFKRILHRRHMPRRTRSQETIIRHTQFTPRRFELWRQSINKRLGVNPLRTRRPLNLESVLIQACQEKHVTPPKPLITRHGVGCHLFVGMPDMRRRIGVINRGGNVKCLGHGLSPPSNPKTSTLPNRLQERKKAAHLGRPTQDSPQGLSRHPPRRDHPPHTRASPTCRCATETPADPHHH